VPVGTRARRLCELLDKHKDETAAARVRTQIELFDAGVIDGGTLDEVIVEAARTLRA
jgi:hypothetical protein